MFTRIFLCSVLLAASARSCLGDEVPLGGFIPFVGISLTDEFQDFGEDAQFSVADPNYAIGGNQFGPGSSAYYDFALLDTGAATHIITQDAASNTGFDLFTEGFQGTEFQPIFGATGAPIDLRITDALGIYAGGVADRTAATTNTTLVMDSNAMRGQTSIAILEGFSDWTLPNILGLPMAAQHGIVIRNDEPQIFQFDNRTMRTPQVEFIDLGSGANQGITRRADLRLEPSASFIAGPAYFPNPFNIFEGHNNPQTPSVVENGGLFLEIDSTHQGNSLNDVELLFDTGADLTVVSEVMAAQMGFDAVLDEPDFVLEVEGAGGVLGGVPGFYLEEMKIDAVGGSIVLQNVPIAVLNVPDPTSPANVIDGIIGMHVFAGRNLVIDAAPAFNGPGFVPSLYISDPVTQKHQWATTAGSEDWATAGNWAVAGVPDNLWIAEARNVSGSDQRAGVATDSTVFQLAVSGTPTAKMTVDVLSGATLTTFGEALIEDGGELRLSGGKLDSQVVNIVGGTLAGNGEIFAGTGPVEGVVRNLGGTVAPDGLLSITGDFSNLEDGTIAIDLFSGGNDAIDISRNAFLNGTLEVSLDPNFIPTIGQQFTLFTFGDSASLNFGQLDLPLGFAWDLFVDNGTDSIILEALSTATIPGDFDNNQMVNQADLAMWEAGYASGSYSGLDFLAWQRNYGYGTLQAVVTVVPEPAVGLMLLGVVVAFPRFRSR